MVKIDKVCKEVLERTEWVAIVTQDGCSPHLAATWGDYIRMMGIINDEIIVIPAGHYNKTEENLKKNNDIQLMIATKKVKGSYGPGQGCLIQGDGEVQIEGTLAEQVKKKFPWARGALVIKIREIKTQL